MTSTRRIDPELLPALAVLPKTPFGAIDLSDIPTARRTLHEMATRIAAQAAHDTDTAPDAHVAVEIGAVTRPDGPAVPLRVFRPAGLPRPAPCLLWFFGGGQILGAADEEDPYLTALATRTRCVVVAVDYRLAPEWPAPAAAEDGYTAYTHLVEHAEQHGLDRQRIGIAAVSGGGGIAVAVTLMVRDRGAQPPRLLSLNWPMLDDRNQTPSSREFTDVGIFDRDANQLAWNAVLGGRAGTDDVTAYQAPARATDYRGLPPTFVAVGEIDVFRDEDLAFVLRLVADDVPAELHLYPGAYHGWDRFAPASSLARSFTTAWDGFLQRNL